MDANAVVHFLEILGLARKNIKADSEWITCTCPVAGLTHESGQDKRPSCRITVNETGPSVWYCFGCSEKAHWLPHLVWLFWASEGEYPWDAARFLVSNEIFTDEEEDEFGVPIFSPVVAPGWANKTRRPVEKIPDRIVQSFPLLTDYCFSTTTVWDWIESRGVSRETIETFGVRYWPERRSLIFPHRSAASNVVLLRARRVGEKEIFTVSPELVDYDGPFPSRREIGCWFGPEGWVNSRTTLVEGEFDAMRLYELGVTSVLASGGSKITNAQLSMLSSRSLILGMDADKSGQRARDRIRKAMQAYATCWDLDWSLLGYKDAGELQDRLEYEYLLNASPALT